MIAPDVMERLARAAHFIKVADDNHEHADSILTSVVYQAIGEG